MKNLVAAAVALSALFLFTSGAHAQTWAAGYPKTGTVGGTILVRATVTFGAGTTTTGKVIVTTWNAGGGVQKQQTFKITAGQTGDIDTGELTVTGLTSGQNYNVTVDIQASSGGNTYDFLTDPKQKPAG